MLGSFKKLYEVGLDWGWFLNEVRSAVKPGDKLLDAGAGECKWGEHFPDVDYISLDYKVGDEEWDFSPVQIHANLNESIPLEDNSIDAIISIQVLEHLSNPQQALNEMFRVLKPGGHLFFTTPLCYQEHQQPWDFFRYTRYGLRHITEAAGFDVTYIKAQGGYFMLMRNMLMQFHNAQYFSSSPLIKLLSWLPRQIIKVFTLVLLPPILKLLDTLDTTQEFTLGYTTRAVKPKA